MTARIHWLTAATCLLITACHEAPRVSPTASLRATPASVPSADLQLTLEKIQARRTPGDLLQLTLHVTVLHREAKSCAPQSPAVVLFSGESELLPFYGPGLAPPLLAPNVRAPAVLHYTLRQADLTAPLTLQSRSSRIAIHEPSTGFIIASLPENQTCSLTYPDWQLLPN